MNPVAANLCRRLPAAYDSRAKVPSVYTVEKECETDTGIRRHRPDPALKAKMHLWDTPISNHLYAKKWLQIGEPKR